MAVLINKRSEAAPRVQEILTRFGCIIRVRLGVHEVEACREEGLILLQLCGNKEDISQLEKELKALDLVRVKKMDLE
ncbi:MAG: hypothetical protein ACOWWO_15440 [Peptococcaceae bacterium]